MPSVFRAALVAASVWLAAVLPATAQTYPSRPVTLVVAFTPGGPSDVISRIVGRKLEDFLGQPFVILNRPGAGGNLAAEQVAQSAPDGHTLLMGNNGILATNPALYKRPGYDPQKDFTPVILVGGQANILVVNPKVAARTVAELAALARSRGLTYASSGHGQAPHLAAELFKTRAGVDIRHVPYKGAAPALQDVISGEVDMMFATAVSVIGHIRAGTVRTIAVTTRTRTALLPEVATIHEQGLPDFDASSWHGIVAPSATPREVITRLHSAAAAVLRDAAVAKSLTDLGVDIIGGTPEEFGAYITSEIPKWTAVVKASGAKME